MTSLYRRSQCPLCFVSFANHSISLFRYLLGMAAALGARRVVCATRASSARDRGPLLQPSCLCAQQQYSGGLQVRQLNLHCPLLMPQYGSTLNQARPPSSRTHLAHHLHINPSHPLPTFPAVPAVVSSPDSFLGYFLALNRSALRYAHAQGLFFDPSNVIFGQEGALREAIDRGGGSWGISPRAFVFHFKGATVHKRRLSLWSNEPPTRAKGGGDKGDEASDYVRCRLRQVMARFV